MTIPDNVTSLDQVRPEGDRAWNEKKKERTRAQLIDAAIRLVAARGLDNVTINDIVTDVAMAPGTFYNYYPSLDAMLEDLAGLVQTGLRECIAQRAKARDPGARIALVLRACLRRAREDSAWAQLLGQFALRGNYGIGADLLQAFRSDISEGIEKGQFTASDDDAAPDLVIGTLLTGVRRLATGDVAANYDRQLSTNILRGLGMVSAAALERAQRGL